MAAVTNNIESHEVDGVERSDIEVDQGSLMGLAGPAAKQKSVSRAHTSLTKFAWLRTIFERELAKRSYELRKTKDGEYFFVVTPSFERRTLPWSPFPSDDYCRFGLWSEFNAKMACPSFALPAGGLLTGGTCPGADAGQTITPVDQRTARMEGSAEGWRLPVVAPGTDEKPLMKEGLTICSSCYATGGNFAYASNQVAEVIRYWWIRQNIEAGRSDFVAQTFVDSIKHLDFPKDRHGIKPIRLHDSGDFFSQKYADVWIAIADELATSMPDVVIWAPSRTWAMRGWNEYWAARLGNLRSLQTKGRPNLVVRPSAYNFGDAAPGAFHPTNAKGSTSLYAPSAKVPEQLRNRTEPKRDLFPSRQGEPRADFNCQVYGAEETSCTASRAPDGKVGCRACWVHPELSINYSAH